MQEFKFREPWELLPGTNITNQKYLSEMPELEKEAQFIFDNYPIGSIVEIEIGKYKTTAEITGPPTFTYGGVFICSTSGRWNVATIKGYAKFGIFRKL